MFRGLGFRGLGFRGLGGLWFRVLSMDDDSVFGSYSSSRSVMPLAILTARSRC